jgi:hypothetical protein
LRAVRRPRLRLRQVPPSVARTRHHSRIGRPGAAHGSGLGRVR